MRWKEADEKKQITAEIADQPSSFGSGTLLIYTAQLYQQYINAD